jgi:nucleoside-diphosphate-sugar epimerase
MRRVLIAGCGYVGSAAAKLFQNKGWHVTAWSRSGELTDQELAVDSFAVDLRDGDAVRRRKFDCDVVVHCASSRGANATEYRRIYRDGVQNLIDAFPGAHLIFTSSTSVYAQRDGSWVDENSPAEPEVETAKVLRETEEIVLARGGTVLRLGGIYGPHRSFLLQSVKAGTAAIGAFDRYINQIHRGDAAAAIAFVAERAEVIGPRLLNVVDNEPAPRSEILCWLAVRMQMPLAPPAETPNSNRGSSNKRVSNARLRALGWSPMYPSYKEGFLQSVFAAELAL